MLLLLDKLGGKDSLQAERCREGFLEEGWPQLDEDRAGTGWP